MNIKKILLKSFLGLSLLATSVNAEEFRAVFHGFSKHDISANRLGEKFNETNYGLGLEYNTYTDNNQFYFSSSANIIKDSYFNPFYFMTAGMEYRTKTFIPVSFGILGLVGAKKLQHYNWNWSLNAYELESEQYLPMGAIMPIIKFYFGDATINYSYSPSVEFKYQEKNVHVVGFHYVSFTYKI